MSGKSLNINSDQHQLCVDAQGNLINGSTDGTFVIYDTLKEGNKLIEIPISYMPQVVALLISKPTKVMSEEESPKPEMNNDPCPDILPSDSSNVDTDVWIKNSGKPSARDIQARDEFIKLVGSEHYQKLLKDKKSCKKDIFTEIGKLLLKKGFTFGGRDPGIVCKTKWKNMEAETLKIIAAAGPKNTGGGKRKKPDYFDDIFDIVKDTAKACPKNIEDTLPGTSSKEQENINQGDEKPKSKDDDSTQDSFIENEEEEHEARNSPFLKVKTSAKPNKHNKKANNNDILEFLKQDALKDKQNEGLIKFMKKKAKNDNRKKDFLNVLKSLAGKKRKGKGKEKETSSESSDSSDEDKSSKSSSSNSENEEK